MKLVRLSILAAGAFYVYKRFFADSGAGAEETQRAEPFSSDELPGEEPQRAAPAAATAASDGERTDPLTRPSWLDPADAG